MRWLDDVVRANSTGGARIDACSGEWRVVDGYSSAMESGEL